MIAGKLAIPALRAILKAEGLTGADLAYALEVEPSTVSRWLAGAVQPTEANLRRLELAVGVKPGDLITPTAAELELRDLRAKLAELSYHQPEDDF